MISKPGPERANDRKLHVLIVSPMGAHQRAIQALCASFPQITRIDKVPGALQAFEMIRDNPPDLVILGVTLAENSVCELLSQINALADPPYCIALTVSEYGTCLDRQVSVEQTIPTTRFADRLPEILDRVYAQ